MTVKVGLLVNDEPVSVNYFVEGLIDHTVGGIIASLEGVEDIGGNLVLTIDGDTVAITLSDAPVSMNAFVQKITKGMVTGMVAALKGVGKINRVTISITR